MKKIIILLALALTTALSYAADSEKMKQANEAYKAEKYSLADSLYNEVLKSEGVSTSLYYNLGNAKYKQNEIGHAILNYERALKLNPNNEDAKFNLEMAKAQTVDKIETLEKFVLTEWNESIQNGTSSNGWAKWSIAAFILTLVLCGLYMFSPKILWKKIAFFTGIFTLFFCSIALYYAKAQHNAITQNESAIITAPTVTVKSAPDESSTELFVIHEGAKVRIKSKLGEWTEIQMEDGNAGWIKADKAEII
ncbi:MAG: tetratricopeptide repeat protein [Paludibacteraceae bacterium]|nr:tetratricopeptide repeat protein [Paludibacteraceae bacterium]